MQICALNGGTANASIASWAEAIVAIPQENADMLTETVGEWSKMLQEQYAGTDAKINIRIEKAEAEQHIVGFGNALKFISEIPYGVQCMRQDMPDTVMTSNNVGVIAKEGNTMTVSCHTRSFDMEKQRQLSLRIRNIMTNGGADNVRMLMDTGSWVERADSPLLALTCETFRDVLNFEPKKVAMHFVLEAAYYVEKYPGVEMASIGPRIIEPHSTSERVDLDTADNIWRVTVELLRRLAK